MALASLFQPEKTRSFPSTTLRGFLLVPSIKATGRPWLRAALSLNHKVSGLGFLILSREVHITESELWRKNLTP